MISERRLHLSAYLTRLLSSGRAVFSRDEAIRHLGKAQGRFLTRQSDFNATGSWLMSGGVSTRSSAPDHVLARLRHPGTSTT